MLESAFIDFALPTMTCPVTGTAFSTDDIIYLRQAATGFAASGKVEATVYRPNKN